METYILKPKRGDVPALWGTYAMKLFTDKRDWNIMQLLDFLGKQEYTLSDIIDMVWAAAQYGCRKQGISTDFTDLEVSEWIDECGGMAGEQISGFVKHVITSVLVNTTDAKKKPTRARK